MEKYKIRHFKILSFVQTITILLEKLFCRNYDPIQVPTENDDKSGPARYNLA